MFRIAIRLWTHYRIALFVILMPALALAWASGPPDGHTGAPDENNCSRSGCHDDFDLNSGPGAFSITAPTNFNPGDTVNVSVSLSQSGQQRWGFEVTVLNASNEPVGKILLTDPTHTQLDTGMGEREYIKHTASGTYFDTPDASPGWNFKWAAPTTTTGQVTFWGAGNAANGNASYSGDYIYTTSRSMQGDCPVQLTGDVDLSNTISSADIIAMVGYVFKGGQLEVPCEGGGDVNCDSKVSSADIIYMVNYVFKSSIPPCDVCQLIPKSWPCQ